MKVSSLNKQDRLNDLGRMNKAISTVVVNLLIMVIIVSVGSSLYAWTVIHCGNYQTQVGAYLSSRSETARERLLIEKVWFRDANNDTLYETAQIYTRNIGKISITIVEVSIDGVETTTTSPTLPLQLAPEEVGEIKLTLKEVIPKGTPTLVTVATERGTTLESYSTVG